MNFSYWERESWFSEIDFVIIGSGITGLNCALELRVRFPKAKIVVLEKGLLPSGASTKNAGFATFGSLSEIMDDLRSHSDEEVLNLIKRRLAGLELLRKNLGDDRIRYRSYGGYELFTLDHKELYEESVASLDKINNLLQSVFKEKVFSLRTDPFSFGNSQKQLIYNPFEGQINTGEMMKALLTKVQAQDVVVLNSVEVKSLSDQGGHVVIQTDRTSFLAKKALIATNGFASHLGIEEVKPARAQVLITKPISNLRIKGTFHIDRGFYYFRNVGNRILFGGGRNLDLEAEETYDMSTSDIIQNRLDLMLQEVIFPGQKVEVDMRWSGIMGIGNLKQPIVKLLSPNIGCGVRLGGMGVAIGSKVGKELADLIERE